MALDKSDKQYIEKMFAVNRIATGVMIDGAKDELKDEMKKHRSDIMNHIDGFAGEIKTNREERTVQSHHISENRDRIEKLEKVVATS